MVERRPLTLVQKKTARQPSCSENRWMKPSRRLGYRKATMNRWFFRSSHWVIFRWTQCFMLTFPGCTLWSMKHGPLFEDVSSLLKVGDFPASHVSWLECSWRFQNMNGANSCDPWPWHDQIFKSGWKSGNSNIFKYSPLFEEDFQVD